jgi:hypothetical protein
MHMVKCFTYRGTKFTHVYPMSLCAPHFHGTDGQCLCFYKILFGVD